MRFERAAIVGVGLIGGSLALAARAAGLIGEAVGVGRSAANLRIGLERGLIDRATQDPAAIGPVDLVVLAVPVQRTAAVAATLLPHVPADAVFTDVGSVKALVVEEMEALLRPPRTFVGAHPIAGSEQTGAAAAAIDLFRGAPCVLTPTPVTAAAALAGVRELWEGVGAHVEVMSAAAHDRALAWTSHLPHAVAYALVQGLARTGLDLSALTGPSWRDATRVAASSAELWRDIFLANAEAVGAALDGFAAELERLREAVARRDEAALTAVLEAAVAAKRGRRGGTA